MISTLILSQYQRIGKLCSAIELVQLCTADDYDSESCFAEDIACLRHAVDEALVCAPNYASRYLLSALREINRAETGGGMLWERVDDMRDAIAFVEAADARLMKRCASYALCRVERSYLDA